jgi:hypothetical protein
VSVAKAVHSGVAYLRRAQRPDGGFIGQVSPDEHDFSHTRKRPTIFFTALILASLHESEDSATIRKRAAAFLLSHAGAAWSWNYWMRTGEGLRMPAYPDDLDDTACALIAVGRYAPDVMDGEVLGHLANQLISAEVEPGGPYRTWLVDTPASAALRTPDIAVNANIGRLLALQNVTLPGLESFLTAAIKEQRLTSPYYVGPIPILYFLSAWYGGSGVEQLREMVNQQLRAASTVPALTQALLVTAGVHLGCDAVLLRSAIRYLQAAQRVDGSWPAAAMYYEMTIDGAMHCAGSAALTTAFCIEALTTQRQLSRLPTAGQRAAALPVTPAGVVRQLVRYSNSVPHSGLRRRFRALVRTVASRDRDHQITGMADRMAQACAQTLPPTTLLQLNAGSLAGWVAYTIYDDFLDGEGKVELLGVANLALRATLASFRAALPESTAFQQLVDDAFSCMDGANTWEVVSARATVRDERLRLSRLPQYGDYAQLAERSWGHTLASCGVLMAAGFAVDSAELVQLQRFFRHFLIARQLNDDAHDWEDDIRCGQISAVVAMLLRKEGTKSININLTGEFGALRERFWEETIVQTSILIQGHIDLAREALAACQAIRHPELLSPWIDKLEHSAQAALAGRAEAKRFIATMAPPQL